jgi:hypothetical protein
MYIARSSDRLAMRWLAIYKLRWLAGYGKELRDFWPDKAGYELRMAIYTYRVVHVL